MTAGRCERFTLADLTDYAAGNCLGRGSPIEEHLFSCTDCGARAAELDALVRAIPRGPPQRRLAGS